MRAAVDIGSNTVQMLAGQICNGQVIPQYTFLTTTRLGDLAAPGILSPQSIEATVAALLEIKRILDAASINEVYVVATSAVREAANRQELINRVEEACLWQIEILRGDEEAALSFLGASSLVKDQDCLMMDVGGGSSEIIFRQADRLQIVSVEMGAVRAKKAAWDRAEIKSRLEKTSFPFRIEVNNIKVVGIGGSFTSAVAVLHGLSQYDRKFVHGKICTYEQFQELWAILEPLSEAERCAYSPLLRKRGEIVVQGLAIILSLMEVFSIRQLLVSDAGILDGILLQKER